MDRSPSASRQDIAAELQQTRLTFNKLLAQASPTDLRRVYHYGTQHFDHHLKQLTLDQMN